MPSLAAELPEFDVRGGWTWAAALTIHPRPGGDGVVYQVGPAGAELGPILTTAVDGAGHFVFSATDARGVPHAIVDGKGVLRAGVRAFVLCELAPSDPGRWRASLWVNGEEIEKREFAADFGGPVRARQSVGAALVGDRRGAFTLSEMMVYFAPLKAATKQGLFSYLAERYGAAG